ncbi:hypothetical protein RHS03_07698, partial [Rhizoctonia solani]
MSDVRAFLSDIRFNVPPYRFDVRLCAVRLYSVAPHESGFKSRYFIAHISQFALYANFGSEIPTFGNPHSPLTAWAYPKQTHGLLLDSPSPPSFCCWASHALRGSAMVPYLEYPLANALVAGGIRGPDLIDNRPARCASIDSIWNSPTFVWFGQKKEKKRASRLAIPKPNPTPIQRSSDSFTHTLTFPRVIM